MKFSKVIKIRRIEFDPIVQCMENELYIPLIDTRIKISEGWQEGEKKLFSRFRSDFPISTFCDVNKEEEKKIKKQLFAPLFILERIPMFEQMNSIFIIAYLFRRYALTGKSLLNIKSLIKLEQSWASYIVNITGLYNGNKMRKLIIDNHSAFISEPVEFKYTWKHDLEEVVSRLHILMIDIDDFVLSLYFIDNDNNPISKGDLDVFIDGIVIKNQ